MKQNFKRFLSWTLALLMALSLLPAGLLTVPAHAASGTVTGLNDPEIGVSYDGGDETTWTAAEKKIQGSIAAGRFDIFGKKTTLTITNKKKKAAILSFSYTIGNQGTIAVDGSTVTENGQFSKKLNPNGSVTIYIEVGRNTTSQITLQDILLVVDAKPTVWFQPSENGTYSVDGTQIKEATPSSKNSQTPYQLVAEPNDGYQFQCWYNLSSNKCISTKPSINLNIEDACYITAKFSLEGVNLFYVGEQVIEGLEPAIEYAQQQNIEQVTLQSENALLEGDYVIPSGITLLIPFDQARTLYKSKPIALPNTGSVSAKKNEFKRLTLAEGASITVLGELSVGGKYRAGAGGSPGYMSGDYGQIWLEEGSTITAKNSGSLYAWGFISGAGKVTVESGGSVYEWFQVTDFRGGTATSGMTSGDVFPISQYYVQNIESELILHSGAVEVAYAAIYADSKNYYSSIPFIGQDGMFCLESGTLTKQYDGTTDRINFNLNGVAEVNSLNLELAGTSVSSTTYVLPLTNNMSIDLTESSALTVNQTAALLPGTQTNIAQGAELVVPNGTSLYVYDAEQWGGYCGAGNKNFIPVSYSPSKSYTRTENDLIDAEINVNGTLTAAGAIYTTADGADIHSSAGSGKYVQQGAPGEEQVTHQCRQESEAIGSITIYKAVPQDIPITAAKLHNGDGSYTETKNYPQGSEIKYEYNAWGGKPAAITVSFNANGGSGTMSAQSGTAGQNITLSSNCFTYADHTFTGWNTAANGTGKTYDDGATASFAEDTILYAQWTKKPVVTFSANGGDGSMSLQTVEPNAATTLIANAFTRADYDFTGWNTAANGSGTAYADQESVTLSGNCTLYAQWTLHKYRVRWLNWDRSVLQEGYYTCEEKAAWDDGPNPNPIPTRPEDENYTYKFVGWGTDDASLGFYPHKDVDFTAQFNQIEKLTVTFDAGGGTGTMDSVKIPNGSTGTSYTLPKCRFTAPQGKLFDGWLITGTVGYNPSELYDLSDEPWDEESLLAFSNLTLKASWKDCTHTWDNGTVTTAATCTVAGVRTFTCSVCNATRTETIPANGHTGGRATCKEKAKCETCGEEYGALDPTNHAGTETDWIKTENTHKETYRCCGAVKTEEAAHTFGEWSDGKHTCSICGYEAKCGHNDANKDHKCDTCGKELSQCADTNNDHKCDICGKTLSQCADNDKDHKCDICGKALSECLDANNDHKCDICGKTLSECLDENKDHKCDICGKALSECLGENKDHKCDICGKTLTECADANKDHKCDICGKTLSECLDTNSDHKCDTCGETLSQCADNDKNHKCDTCGETLSQCADANKDHKCDTCGKALSECLDENKDHKCDICGKTLTECADANKDHKCDICGETLSQCADTNKDHKCDTCGKELSQCADNDKNHRCDTCGKELSVHIFGKWSVTTPADYVTPGEKTRTCSVCNAAEKEAIPSILQQLKDLEITATKDGYTMTLPTGRKVLVLLAGYSGVGQLKSIQVLSVGETGEVSFALPSGASVVIFFLQEDYKPLCSRKVTQ